MGLETGPKPVGRKRGLGDSRRNKTKRGEHLQCRRKKQKKLSMSSITSQRRARARARGAHSNSSSKRSSSEESASTVEEITSSGTAKSGKRCVRNSALRETSCLAPFAHTDG